MKRRIAIALAVTIPLALFFAARVTASKRPVVIGQHQRAESLQFSPDGQRMLSYSRSDVSSWNLPERRRVATWKSGLSYVFSPDSRRLVAFSNSYDSIDLTHARTVISGVVSDVATGQARVRLRDSFTHPLWHEDYVGTPVWSADGREIWVISAFHLRCFDARSGQLLARVTLFSLRDFDVFRTDLLLPNHSFVVSSNKKGIELRDVKTGAVARSWKIKSPFWGVTPVVETASPNSQFLAVGFDGRAAGTTRIYRISDHSFWQAPPGSAPFMAFSADSQWALFAQDSTFIARDIKDGRELWRRKVPEAQSAMLAPDARHLYNVDKKAIIRRWDVR